MLHRLIFSFLLLTSHLAVHPKETVDREYWVNRYLSVSYPLKQMSVTSPYGTRKDPFTGATARHSGLDLKAFNEEVFSMFDGKVTHVGADERSGKYVTLRYGEYTVSFCHLSKILVKDGDEVFAGDVVGISGATGRATAPHLHITCKQNEEYKNPSLLIKYIRNTREECFKKLSNSGKGYSTVFTLGSKKDFFLMYGKAAMRQQSVYGIPSSVILAQMAYESAWGLSDLALRGNNFFGIKCSAIWLAEGRPYSLHNDDRPNEKFCNYGSADESIEHHSQILMGDRYKRCRKFSATDYHNWLVAIKQAGYATDPAYVQKVEGIIKKHKLYLYDLLADRKTVQ